MLWLKRWQGGNAYKSKLWLVDADQSGYICGSPIGQNQLRPGWRTGSTVQVCTSSVQHYNWANQSVCASNDKIQVYTDWITTMYCSTIYLYVWIYIKCNVRVCVCVYVCVCVVFTEVQFICTNCVQYTCKWIYIKRYVRVCVLFIWVKKSCGPFRCPERKFGIFSVWKSISF
jgi:hypothetical protein